MLAPEYPEVVIGDDYEPSTYFEATVNLLHHVIGRYAVDRRRVHATGQSMGAMLALGMNTRHPDLLASSFIVAGQWPADQAEPLAKEKLWVVVCQDDTKAYPTENAIMDVLRAEGATVTTATWNGSATPAELSADARAMETRHTAVNYTSFAPGSLSTATNAHPETWRIACTIPTIRDWTLRQSR